MVAPLPSCVSLSTEGFFALVVRPFSAVCNRKVIRCCSVVVFVQNLITSLCTGAHEETWIVHSYSPGPSPTLCRRLRRLESRLCTTGPPSILPTRHHCLSLQPAVSSRAKSENSARRGRPYATHFPTRVDDQTVAAASLSSSRLRGLRASVAPSQRPELCLSAALGHASKCGHKDTNAPAGSSPRIPAAFLPPDVLLLFTVSNVHCEAGEG